MEFKLQQSKIPIGGLFSESILQVSICLFFSNPTQEAGLGLKLAAEYVNLKAKV